MITYLNILRTFYFRLKIVRQILTLSMQFVIINFVGGNKFMNNKIQKLMAIIMLLLLLGSSVVGVLYYLLA